MFTRALHIYIYIYINAVVQSSSQSGLIRIFLARLYSTHESHWSIYIECFRRIVPVDIFCSQAFTAKLVCADGILQLQVWAELGAERCFPVKRKCLQQRMNVVVTCFACFTDEFQYNVIKNLRNLSYFSLHTL